MNNFYIRKIKFCLVFTAFVFLGIAKVYAQPADAVPNVKYLFNNYASVLEAACDTCTPIVGKPLRVGKPIPFPPGAALDLIPHLSGLNADMIPGLSAPNFFLGGSPEIKGLVKTVAGMKEEYAQHIRKTDMLYFAKGAQGVAVNKAGKIITASRTILPNLAWVRENATEGFFSFKSSPARMPTFNDRSEEAFTKSPVKIKVNGVLVPNPDTAVAYFALNPRNDDIMYASLQDPSSNGNTKSLARKDADGWKVLNWDIPGGIGTSVWGALTVDLNGNLYVADSTHHIVVMIRFDGNGDPFTWTILAGQMDVAGFKNSEDGREALFNKPSGICIDEAGNIYIGDAGNNRIRIIESDGDVKTYAGTGEKGFKDDHSWSDAKFWQPTALAFNEKTKSLYVVDFGNKLIREVNESRHVSTLAGNAGYKYPDQPERFLMYLYYRMSKLNMDPDESSLDSPTGIAIDPSGHGLYVSDGMYIKYVSTFEAEFELTAAFGDRRANVLGQIFLPPGLSMNPKNGAFFGVPLITWEPTVYTIRAKNSKDFSLVNGVIRFEVVNCPDEADTTIDNKTIALRQLPFTWNKKVFDNAGTATVTLQTALGCDSIVKMNLSIYPEFNYNSEPYILSLNQQIKAILPTARGSIIETFSVAPPLPTGLVLNAQTGEITGMPLAVTSSQTTPAVGPQTPPQYPGPWTLQDREGADLTGFKISDGNGKTVFENYSGFRSLQGSAGAGTGTAGAYTDFSGLAPIKMFSNNPYSVELSNTLKGGGRYDYSLNDIISSQNYMNSYAVFIDYNRDGDFEDDGERVYKSAGPQREAHAEAFSLNIPASAKAGVTKMRIYAVEAWTILTGYQFYDPNRPGSAANKYYWVYRTTEQALSFYPFFNDISMRGETDFRLGGINYGEFEDYNINIITPVTQTYMVTGSNVLGSAQAAIKLAVNRPTSSTTNISICASELPYQWNNLTFNAAGTKTDTLRNVMLADSIATLNLTVKQLSSSSVEVEHCGPYTYLGKLYTESGWYYGITIPNAAGCDSIITLKFRQKATASTTNLVKTPDELPFFWNGTEIRTAGTYTYKRLNAELCDSIATLNVLVNYTITYATNNLLTLNQAITPIHPQIQNGYVPPGSWYNEVWGYSISPALPAGLSLNPITGIISGTPTALSPLKEYTIKLNQEGAQLAKFTLSVGEPSFSTTTINNCGPLMWNGQIYEATGTGTYITKNHYGYDSTATLMVTIRDLSASTTNLFLALDLLPYNWNGDSISTEGLHTVHLINAVGCDSAATANVVISPKISYTSPQLLLHNQPIAAITPQQLGGKPASYKIQPALVSGLQFNTATGVITGTPADTLLQPATYTIHALNGAGSDTAQLVMAICNTMATSFITDTCDQYIWNDSTYTTSTTHTRTLTNRGGCDSVVTMHLIIRKSSKGITEAVTACSSYTWYEKTYDTTGIYTKVFPNAVGCDSTLTLKLTVNYPSVNNLYVNLNASDFPYKWRNKTFTTPGTDTIFLKNGNRLGCDSTVRMTVSISAMLPDITYAVTDTILYWENTIETPIAMSNTGTSIPAKKIGERDNLVKFSNPGPGNFLRNTVKGHNGAYYSRVDGNSNVYKLSPSGEWTVFANIGSAINGLAIDTSGNLYVATNTLPDHIKKITPDGNVGDLPGSPLFYTPDNVFVDRNNVLVILEANNYNQLDIVKFNLSTGEYVTTKHDNSPYFDFGPEDMEVDSKGNIYIYKNYDNVVVKIRPDGRMSGIGKKGSDYSSFIPGNGPDATLPTINSMAIDPSNDNLYLMANGRLLRVDTAENISAITGRWFDISKDQIFRVENGKAFIITNATVPTDRTDPIPTPMLYTANVHGVGSLPFMDNYGASGVNNGKVNYTDFDKRIRLDSSGSIVGTPRSTYASAGYRYGSNSSIGYTIIAANLHGTSKAPMGITTKGISYKRESFVTTTLPFVWRGRSFPAATDTATYYIKNRLEVDDTMYLLHLVYEAPPVPFITSDCAPGGTSLTAKGAARSAISFDGINWGRIRNVDRSGDGGLAYYNVDWIPKPGGDIANARTAFEVWIKPESVSGTQYLLTRDSVKTHGTFMGYSIQDGKFVYELIKGKSPSVDDRVSSVSNIEPNVWTHVAASFYDSALHIYINGKLDNTLQTASRYINPFYYVNDSTLETISPDFYLGGLPGKNGYKGEMDELRLFNTKRNEDSIKATMHTILDPNRGGLGLYYRFDGDLTAGVSDISRSGRTATLSKPASSVATSGAPIQFASFKWMPGDSTGKSMIVNPLINTTYTVTVTDYKQTQGSASLLVYPLQGPSITAPAAVSRTNSASSCLVFISDADLGTALATDDCPGVTVKTTGVPEGNFFKLGTTTITYTATNLSGRTKSATQTVTVTDITKPVFSVNLSSNPGMIWPPNHKLKDIALTYTTADNCGKVTNKVTVTSTDPITGVSDGDLSPDWIVTNDHMVQLRAERGNGKEARIYTITVTPVDSSGNVGIPQSTNVTIAHNITGPITGSSFKIGSTVAFNGVFWDKQGNSHTGEWVIDDNTIVKGTVTEPAGTKNGKLTGSYKFTSAGTYKLRMNITDQNKLTSYCTTNEDMEAILVIYDPNGGYTYGGGWFNSTAGALKSDATATGKANFGFAVSYFKGAANPKGETQFELKVGDLEYNALNFEYLSIDGARAQIKGTGKILGGQSGINFMMTVMDGALDGTGIDKIRIKIYNKNTGKVFYDNEGGSDADNPVTRVGTNSEIFIGGTGANTGGPPSVVATNTGAAATSASRLTGDKLVATLQALALPNPSSGHFILLVQGGNNQPLSIRVTDIMGRLVEVRNGLPANNTISLGAAYRSGVYFAEVLQGKEKLILKLIKQ